MAASAWLAAVSRTALTIASAGAASIVYVVHVAYWRQWVAAMESVWPITAL